MKSNSFGTLWESAWKQKGKTRETKDRFATVTIIKACYQSSKDAKKSCAPAQEKVVEAHMGPQCPDGQHIMHSAGMMTRKLDQENATGLR